MVQFDDTCFFFSSRRRHTRYWRDWSSDVCSSDLQASLTTQPRALTSRLPSSAVQGRRVREGRDSQEQDDEERSEERRVGKSVDLGGRRIIKKKNKGEQIRRTARQHQHIQHLIKHY